MAYGLTDQEKQTLKWFVQETLKGNLPQEFSFAQVMGGNVLDDYKGDPGNVPHMTPALLDALAEAGMIRCKHSRKIPTGRFCSLTEQAFQAVDTNFEPVAPQTTPQITIGALIRNMSGGHVQAVGIALDAEISQVISDPDLMHSQVEKLTKGLLNEVKSALNADEMAEYTQAVHDLREQLLSEKPDPSPIRELVRFLGFLGDIEGTLALMTRVWLWLHPLLLIAAAKLG